MLTRSKMLAHQWRILLSMLLATLPSPFFDNDLVLGSKPHNRPSFVTSYIKEQRVERILVDGGSAINIMPKSTMNDLEITVVDLSKSRMVIQGFSLESQRSIGMICLELTMGDLSTSSIFHVIDFKTSYKLLLGHQWVYEHGIVASTLHQCLKYYCGGERKINGGVKSFPRQSHILLTLSSLKRFYN